MHTDIHTLINFINIECDMLDFLEYDDWLNLWDKDGLYIVPVDQQTDDFANNLNLAYDNDLMRRMRVERLLGGEAISTTPPARTIRTPSRFRILSTQDDIITIRCAQIINESRQGRLRTYPADVTYTLRPNGDTFIIMQKVVRLQSSELASISCFV